MLLCQRLCRPKRHIGQTYKAYSTQKTSPYPFRNLRAFPFTRSPLDAQRIVGVLAASLSGEKILQSFLAAVFPVLGFEPIKPLRLTPVWFPGWIIDAEVQGMVNIKDGEDRASAQIFNAKLNTAVTSQAGSDYKVLSTAPLAPPDAYSRESVPFTKDLLRQYDLDVACIPYNISPFSILNIARRLPYREAIVAEDFHFDPSSLRPTLFAAYPVLIPVYLLQYEFNFISKNHYLTMIIEAYGTDGNVWLEPLGPKYKPSREIFLKVGQWLGNRNPFSESIINVGYSKEFVEHVGFSHPPHKELGKTIQDYLERAMKDVRTPTTLAAASVNNMESLVQDKRVREFTSEDRKPTLEWLQLGLELMMIQRVYETMLQAHSLGNIRVHGLAKTGNKPFIDHTLQFLSKRSQNLEAQRLLVKPIWAKTEEDLNKELQAKARTSK